MRVGVIFPQIEIGTDPALIRDYAQTAEGLGYSHNLAFDHVLGANRASRPDWKPPYDHKDQFHEPFVLFGFLGAVTQRIEFVTGVLILPQRQTALVAKQAATVDVLTNGRLRLGVGIGWNHVEYEALGEDFTNRGIRSEEQVAVLRELMTKELVTFEGRWHRITDAGINPLPVQRPMPIWFGGHADAVKRRIARMGDGWFPLFQPDARGREQIEKLRGYVREAGRDPAAIGIESWITYGDGDPDRWQREIAAWRDLGATHAAVNTMRAGLPNPAAHIDAIRRFHDAAAKVAA
jgi:probable F420-dependent oxidoreductase